MGEDQIIAAAAAGAAASRLGIAQPALSATIRRLESDIGQPLFNRLPRGVSLTDAGQKLLPSVYEIFSTLESLRSDLDADRTTPRGEVSIGLPPSAAAVFLRPFLEKISALYPHISIRVVEAMSGYLRDWVESGDLDMAVGFNMTDTQSLLSRPLFEEELMLIGTKDAMRDLPDPFPITRLPELPLILTSKRHQLRGLLEQQLAAMNKKLNIRFEIDAGHELVRLVSNGVGFGIFARSAFCDEIARDLVRAIPLVPSYSRKVCVIHHRRKRSDRVVKRTLDTISDCALDLRNSGHWLT